MHREQRHWRWGDASHTFHTSINGQGAASGLGDGDDRVDGSDAVLDRRLVEVRLGRLAAVVGRVLLGILKGGRRLVGIELGDVEEDTDAGEAWTTA